MSTSISKFTKNKIALPPVHKVSKLFLIQQHHGTGENIKVFRQLRTKDHVEAAGPSLLLVQLRPMP